MSIELEPGHLVANRYRVEKVLGRGGFAVTYLCSDDTANRQVAVKELAPLSATRDSNGELRLGADTEASNRLISQFMEESKLLAKLRVPGVVRIFDAFRSAGTAFSVMEFIEGAKTLSQVLKERGRLTVEEAKLTLEALATALQGVHDRGFLHRDIKPSNILITPQGEPLLIDFGSAREWHQDATVRHTALVTPGYSPIEQLSESGRRGPSSDIYSLAATGYELLSGEIPPSAPDRIGGKPLPLLSNFRDDVPPELEEAIRAGLSIKASDRPQSATEFVQLISYVSNQNTEFSGSELDRMDAALDRLKNLKFAARECPACGSVLETPKPLKAGNCPVCRAGQIESRSLTFDNCASCLTGVLKRVHNNPLHFCPQCRIGELKSRGLLKRNFECNLCAAAFERLGKGYKVIRLGNTNEESSQWIREMTREGQLFSEDFFLDRAGRSEWIRVCDSCGAQWDELQNSKMRLVHEPLNRLSEYSSTQLTEDEWARLSLSLPLDAGNACCNSCGADFFLEVDYITLLDADRDAFGFLHQYQGRRLKLSQLPWLAVGKISGENGLLCRDCGLEFDTVGDYLRLRETPGPPLSFWLGKALPFEDWHRVSRGLPQRNEQQEYLEKFDQLLKKEILAGNIEWGSDDSEVRWSSGSRLLESGDSKKVMGTKGKLVIWNGILEFQARFSRKQFPIDAITDASAEGGTLSLKIDGERDKLTLEVEPVEMQVSLRSGDYEVRLDASDLANLLMQPEFSELPMP